MPVAEGHCEAPCVKSRSQNWDLTSWKSHPKSFQVSVLETASVKIQASKLRSQVLKTMSWKPYPKISQVFLPGLTCPCRPGLPCPGHPGLPVSQKDYDLPTYQMLGRFCRWIKMQNCRVRQTDARTDYLNLYIRYYRMGHGMCSLGHPRKGSPGRISLANGPIHQGWKQVG